jgi:hypothetical protein
LFAGAREHDLNLDVIPLGRADQRIPLHRLAVRHEGAEAFFKLSDLRGRRDLGEEVAPDNFLRRDVRVVLRRGAVADHVSGGVEFSLRGHYVKEAVPEARTKKQAEQVEIQIQQAIFDRKYNRASAVTRFSDFVDGVFLTWARENKRSWKDDEQRAEKLKEFFDQRAIRDITPLLIEKFTSELRKSDSRYKASPLPVDRQSLPPGALARPLDGL